MKELQKIIGRAGTGKSTYMVGEIVKLLDDGISPRNIGMMTFSKGGAYSFMKKITDRVISTSEELEKKHFKYFRTMHSMASSLIGWKPDDAFAKKHWEMFYNRYYPDINAGMIDVDEQEYWISAADKERLLESHRLSDMEEIHELMQNAMIGEGEFDKLYSLTGRDLTTTRWVKTGERPKTKTIKKVSVTRAEMIWDYHRDRIDPDEMVEFSKNYTEFKDEQRIMTFTDCISQCLKSGSAPPVDYLFVDEFQDFSKLQYELFKVWRDAIDYVWIAGDDAQTVNRWAAANPNFFIDEPVAPVNNIVKLGMTYRHGKEIFENAQKYIEGMNTVQECNVLPNPDIPGEVLRVYGDEWKEHAKFAPAESVLILAASKKWSQQVKTVLRGLTPGITWVNLGDDDIVKRVIEQYNTIVELERGDSVEWEQIEQLIFKDYSLPARMTFTESTMTLSGEVDEHEYKNAQVIKHGLKAKFKRGEIAHRDEYDKGAFEKEFMTREFDAAVLVSHIKELVYFPNAMDMFPEHYATEGVDKAQHRIGTIHKSKGDEADTVILFMAVPYPQEDNVYEAEVRDDILHAFYVGTTRPRTKLIEVYDYLKTGKSYAKAPMDLV